MLNKLERAAQAYYETSCRLAGIYGPVPWRQMSPEHKEQRIACLQAALKVMKQPEETNLSVAIGRANKSISTLFPETSETSQNHYR